MPSTGPDHGVLCSATSSPLGVRPLCFLCVPLCISVVNPSHCRCGRPAQGLRTAERKPSGREQVFSHHRGPQRFTEGWWGRMSSTGPSGSSMLCHIVTGRGAPLCFLCVPLCISVVNPSHCRCGRPARGLRTAERKPTGREEAFSHHRGPQRFTEGWWGRMSSTGPSGSSTLCHTVTARGAPLGFLCVPPCISVVNPKLRRCGRHARGLRTAECRPTGREASFWAASPGRRGWLLGWRRHLRECRGRACLACSHQVLWLEKIQFSNRENKILECGSARVLPQPG